MADVSLFRTWVICERSGDRWLHAVRRFTNMLIPSPLLPVVLPAAPETVGMIMADQSAGIVLWSFNPHDFTADFDALVQIANELPHILHLAADAQLGQRHRLALSEIPVVATIRNPEQLPQLRHLIRGYFANAAESLDY